jgi:hypothetical protein
MIRAALILALMPLLCGAALLEHYVLARQRLQIGADVAAEHGAKAVFSGKDVEAAVRKRLARLSPAPTLGMLRIERPPMDGRFGSLPRAVRVRLRAPWSPPLVPRRLVEGIVLDVRATAVAVPPGPAHPAAVLRVE